MVALSMTIRILGSARVSSATGRIRRGERAGDGVLAIANFLQAPFTTETTKITEFEEDFLSVLRVLRG